MGESCCMSREGVRKKRWPNEAAAAFVAKLVRERGGEQYVYHCDECDGWHTATTRRARKAEGRKRR